MKTLVLGATGAIGTAVTQELIRNHHTIVALARSDTAEKKLRDKGMSVIRGDIRKPQDWAHVIHTVDAIVHVAATFSDDMGEVDRHLIDTLIEEGTDLSRPIRFLYTGGTWLYGETGDDVATEDTSFSPLPSFAWMIENGSKVLMAACFDGIMIHPGMVYHRDGGVLSRFLSSAQEDGAVEVWGSTNTRWPMVHRNDLATAYRLALEKGTPGEHYNVAAEEGVPVGQVVNAINRRFGLQTRPFVRSLSDVIEEQGDWAEGPTLDQQMSSAKIRQTLGWRPAFTDVIAEIS